MSGMTTPGPRNPLLTRALFGTFVVIAAGVASWTYLAPTPGPTAPHPIAPEHQALSSPTPAPAVSDLARPSTIAALPVEKPAALEVAANPAAPQPVPPSVQGPKFDVVRISPQGNAVIAGRGTPGADIIVLDGATEIARTRADARGEFVALPAQPLGPGGRELTLRSKAAGETEVKGEEQVVLAVPARPAPTSPAAGAPNAQAEPGPAAPVVAMLLPQRGAPRMLQEMFTPAAPGSVTLDTVDYDDAGAIQFRGGVAGAPAGSTIRIYVDNRPIGDTQADPAGRWTLKPNAGVTTGVHLVRADRLSPDGLVLARVEMPFQRSEIAPADVAAGRVVVQPGQNLWRLARAAYGHGIQYTVIYLANKDQIRDARRIYPGQAFSVPER